MMARRWTAAVTAVLVLAGVGGRADDAQTDGAPDWPDTFVSRLEALALLQSLNAELLSHNSATLTLEHWCDSHHLASPARVTAVRDKSIDKSASPEQREALGVGPNAAIRYRRVKLVCGRVVLSEADNWYVPARLTADMNALLDTTDLPFGKVVQALNFQRRTLSSRLLWLPLPDGWEMHPAVTASASGTGAAALKIPSALLEHRAILTLPDGVPFSEVIETYTANVLAFSVQHP
jgi:chorismate-pyruvate lyase